MKIVVASFLATLLIGGSVAAQSPQASPITPVTSPLPSPAVSPLSSPATSPIVGPTLTFGATNRRVCKADTVCTWYLTIIDPLAVAADMTTELMPGVGRALTPKMPLPANLAPGTYLVEASAWVQPSATTPADEKVGRVASCATILTVSADPLVTTVDVQLAFKKKLKGCEIAVTFPS
jgi:hypothetical protein